MFSGASFPGGRGGLAENDLLVDVVMNLQNVKNSKKENNVFLAPAVLEEGGGLAENEPLVDVSMGVQNVRNSK